MMSIIFLLFIELCYGFTGFTSFTDSNCRSSAISLVMKNKYDFNNPLVEAVSGFLSGPAATVNDDLSTTNKKIGTRRKSSMKKLASDLFKALNKDGWFVTGNVDYSFFSDNFNFKDPDVNVDGIEQYAVGVASLFGPTAKAEIIDCIAIDNDTLIQVRWRCSGGVCIGPFTFNIKPYIIITDLEVDQSTGLIESQLDKFTIPGYDIVLSALFPFTRSFLSPEAKSIEILREEYKDLK